MYEANISAIENDNIDMVYIGMTSWNWKFRFYNHLQSFRNPTLRNQTVLSKCYWDLKELFLTLVINWKIIKTCPTTNSLHDKCNLCLEEKIYILDFF